MYFLTVFFLSKCVQCLKLSVLRCMCTFILDVGFLKLLIISWYIYIPNLLLIPLYDLSEWLCVLPRYLVNIPQILVYLSMDRQEIATYLLLVTDVLHSLLVMYLWHYFWGWRQTFFFHFLWNRVPGSPRIYAESFEKVRRMMVGGRHSSFCI